MIKNSSKLIFLFIMILGSLITISSNSWLGVWMGLEINLLSFIPLMIDTNNLMSTEASLKYFLTQVFASSMLLFSMTLFMMTNNLIYQLNFSSYSSMMIFISLLIKNGIAPLHFWFPSVMEGINWYSSMILMTWQKIAPMIILSYFIIFNFFYSFIILSVITGALSGINQTSIRKLMAFSSINHMGWMLSAMMFNEYLWLFYFLIYSFISLSLIYFFNIFKLFYMNQMFSMFCYSPLIKFFMLTSFLSLSGLPPFLGFLPKWLVIQSLMNMNQLFLIMIMIMMSLITTYFYLRICYSAFMLNYTELMWNYSMFYKNKNFIFTMMLMFLSIFSLFLITSFIYKFY